MTEDFSGVSSIAFACRRSSITRPTSNGIQLWNHGFFFPPRDLSAESVIHISVRERDRTSLSNAAIGRTRETC